MVLANDRLSTQDRLISAHFDEAFQHQASRAKCDRLTLSRFSTRQNKAPQLDRGGTMNRAAEKETDATLTKIAEAVVNQQAEAA
jgi:hypothetical protein